MFDNLKSDLFRCCNDDYKKASFLTLCRTGFNSMGFQAIVVYRFGRWSEVRFAGPKLAVFRYFFLAFYYVMYHIITKMYGIDIDRRAIIGKGLRIRHFAGIKINPCEIGEFCIIHQHVKIGSTNTIDSSEFPRIGSRVWIGAHARITGNVTVGDNSTISAGAIVTEDVNCANLVTGNPARVVSTLYDNRALLGLEE